MQTQQQSQTTARSEAPRWLFALWVEMIGPPIIWMTQFQVKYVLAGKTLASRHPGLLPGTTIVAVALLLLIAVSAWRHRREAAASPLDTMAGAVGRTRFMTMVGVLNAALFLVVTIAQGLADFYFEPTE
jgi:hypothetical protein